jgi:CRP/FNR family transcriptional regulator, cyclic AMP receptor protein
LNFRRRKPRDVSRNQFLKTVPFFENLSPKQLKILALNLHERQYEEDEYLFELNHPGAALFIIMRGEVAVETTSDRATAAQLAVIKPGEFLGELALLDQAPRSASARATKPTLTLALFRADLNRLEKTEPEIACEVFRTLAYIIGERLKATNRHVNSTRKAA